MSTKWAYATDGENYNSGTFDTKEDAKLEAFASGFDRCDVGEVIPFNIAIDADNIIDQLMCEAADLSGEYSEGWLSHVSDDERNRLSSELTEVARKWIKDTGNTPTFFGIANSEEHYSESDS